MKALGGIHIPDSASLAPPPRYLPFFGIPWGTSIYRFWKSIFLSLLFIYLCVAELGSVSFLIVLSRPKCKHSTSHLRLKEWEIGQGPLFCQRRDSGLQSTVEVELLKEGEKIKGSYTSTPSDREELEILLKFKILPSILPSPTRQGGVAPATTGT